MKKGEEEHIKYLVHVRYDQIIRKAGQNNRLFHRSIIYLFGACHPFR